MRGLYLFESSSVTDKETRATLGQVLMLLRQLKKQGKISQDKVNRIQHILDRSEGDFDQVLALLEPIGISPKVNADVYEIIQNLMTHGVDGKENYSVLSRFLQNRDRLGLKFEQLPKNTPFSVLDLVTQNDNNHPGFTRQLAVKLANITGASKGTSRGKFEILLGIASRNGNIIAQSHTDQGKGDVIIDGVATEVKCFTAGGGRVGNAGVDGVKAVTDVRPGIKTIYNNYCQQLVKTFISSNIFAQDAALTVLSRIKQYGNSLTGLVMRQQTKEKNTSIDLFLLRPINDLLSASAQAKSNTELKQQLAEQVINAYISIWKNFFVENSKSGEYMYPIYDKIFGYIDIHNRPLDAILSDSAIIDPNRYNEFITIIGCAYLLNYHRNEGFRAFMVIAAKNDRDVSVIIPEESLADDNPVKLMQIIRKCNLVFSPPAVRESARQAVLPEIVLKA